MNINNAQKDNARPSSKRASSNALGNFGFITLVHFVFFLVYQLGGCSDGESSRPKVIKITKGRVQKLPELEDSKIIFINSKGEVSVGRLSLFGSSYTFQGVHYTLEGKARVGDEFDRFAYFEEHFLASGEVLEVLVKVSVVSKKNEEYQKKFALEETQKEN